MVIDYICTMKKKKTPPQFKNREKEPMRAFNIDTVNRYFNTPCIYFLYFEEQIVYIGETTQIMPRISAHFKGSKVFDTFGFFEFKGSRLERLECEAALIKKHKPKYNIVHNVDCDFVEVIED